MIAEHESKFADWPRIGNKPIPVPDCHPDRDTFDTDMESLHRLSAHILSQVVAGATVTPSQGLIESGIDLYLHPWPDLHPPLWETP